MMNRFGFLFICGLIFGTAHCLPPGNGFMPNMNNLPMSQDKSFKNTMNTFNEATFIPNANFVPTGYPNNNAINEIGANALAGMPNVPVSNIEVTPYISEVIPSLQYGDISMAGELPIGGTIRVSGCFPVYGMVAVDGSVPSAGTAVVPESFGNQVMDVVNNCASQYFS